MSISHEGGTFCAGLILDYESLHPIMTGEISDRAHMFFDDVFDKYGYEGAVGQRELDPYGRLTSFRGREHRKEVLSELNDILDVADGKACAAAEEHGEVIEEARFLFEAIRARNIPFVLATKYRRSSVAALIERDFSRDEYPPYRIPRISSYETSRRPFADTIKQNAYTFIGSPIDAWCISPDATIHGAFGRKAANDPRILPIAHVAPEQQEGEADRRMCVARLLAAEACRCAAKEAPSDARQLEAVSA